MSEQIGNLETKAQPREKRVQRGGRKAELWVKEAGQGDAGGRISPPSRSGPGGPLHNLQKALRKLRREDARRREETREREQADLEGRGPQDPQAETHRLPNWVRVRSHNFMASRYVTVLLTMRFCET